MPELIFWNVQRLGGGSDQDKARCIDLVIDGYLRPMDLDDSMFEPTGTCADGIVLCEVTSDIVYGGYQISKFGTVPRRGRRATAQGHALGRNAGLVYHANSSYKAATLVHWVAGQLKLTYGNYILVGDLNCSWSELDDHMRR